MEECILFFRGGKDLSVIVFFFASGQCIPDKTANGYTVQKRQLTDLV